MNALPVVMVRNEEFYIERVLRPLAEVFGHVVLGDTGSTDRTMEIARGVPNVEVLELGPKTPAELGQVRRTLGARVVELGAPNMFMVDGDELYHARTLRWLKALEPPEGGAAGFVTMVSVDRADDGQLWEMDDLFNRLAIMPALVPWKGAYPFEIPEVFDYPDTFWYASLPPGFRYHALHLHRLQRSSADADVFIRRQKQFQFSMQDKAVPRTVPLDAERWELKQRTQ